MVTTSNTRSRVPVDDPVIALMHFAQGPFRILMDGVAARWSRRRTLHALDEALDGEICVVHRIACNVIPNGAEICAGLRRPDDLHSSSPNSRRTSACGWDRCAFKSPNPDSIFWRT